ncbi:caspase, EACC1-associated type [Actinoplanes sp. URMC 104]|uniref:caspase family protein n=1 Tax=Actinoplanes sp. URMC 104 TaxID=3423409 RepID=UPI003F1DD6A5
MSGARQALIVANDTYDHDGLRHLLAPQADADALAGVLGDARIGGFDVRVVRNEPAHVIRERIEDLFAESRPDDVLLLHFSCHGLKGESGELFFATRNTRPDRLGSTAVSADFVQRCMRASRSRSVVLLLDCCYGGAFSTGVTVRAAGDVNVLDSFPGGRLGGGRGRAVITASSAMEYAFEGDHLTEDRSPRPSVFTAALVEGLATGEADRDQDGWVSLNELYDYVFDRVRERNPHQTPSRDVEMQGELYVARRSRPVTRPAPLPAELQSVLDHPIGSVRAGAVQELARLAHGRHEGLALAARQALEHLSTDDSRTVAAAATQALSADVPAPPTPTPALTPRPASPSPSPSAPSPAPAPASTPDPEPTLISTGTSPPVPTVSASPATSAPTPIPAAEPLPASAEAQSERAGARSGGAESQSGRTGSQSRQTGSRSGREAPVERELEQTEPEPGRARPPRWVLGTAAAAVLAAGAVLAVLLIDDGDGNSGDRAGTPTANSFTAQSPWRLTIEDHIQGDDNGCTVTVTHSGTPIPVPSDLFSPTGFQMRRSGEFRTTANDEGCLTLPRAGAGAATLPFVPERLGDTDVFAVSGPVVVEVLDDHGNNTCDVMLHDAADGRGLSGKELTGNAPGRLDPAGRTRVYLSSLQCQVRVSAG